MGHLITVTEDILTAMEHLVNASECSCIRYIALDNWHPCHGPWISKFEKNQTTLNLSLAGTFVKRGFEAKSVQWFALKWQLPLQSLKDT